MPIPAQDAGRVDGVDDAIAASYYLNKTAPADPLPNATVRPIGNACASQMPVPHQIAGGRDRVDYAIIVAENEFRCHDSPRAPQMQAAKEIIHTSRDWR